MYKLYEELNKHDKRFMRVFYCVDIAVGLTYLFMALSDNAFMKSEPPLFIALYSLVCGVLIILEISLIVRTWHIPFLSLPLLMTTMIVQSLLIPIDIAFIILYGHFWTEMFLHIITEITMIMIYMRRYMFIRTSKKFLMEHKGSDSGE